MDVKDELQSVVTNLIKGDTAAATETLTNVIRQKTRETVMDLTVSAPRYEDDDFEDVVTEAKGELANFDKIAQKVWAAKDADKKRELIKKEMIMKYHAKDKQEKHLRALDAKKTSKDLDRFAADIMQVAHGNKVI